MFYVLAEIGYHSQLLRTRKAPLQQLETTLVNLGKTKGGILEGLSDGKILFRFPFEGEEFLPELAQFLAQSQETFLELMKKIQGFSLLVDKGPLMDPFEAEKRMLKLLYLTREDNRIWFSPKAYEDFHPFFPMEQSEVLYSVAGRKVSLRPKKQNTLEIWEQFSWYASLKATLEEGIATQGLCLLSSYPIECVTHLSMEILKNENAEYLTIIPRGNPYDVWWDLKLALGTLLKGKVLELMNEEETQCWDIHPQWKNLLEDREQDYYEGDFYPRDLKDAFTFLYGVLSRFRREKKGVTGILWCEPDRSPGELVLWLSDFLKKQRDLPLFIISDTGRSLPPLKAKDIKRWRGPREGAIHPIDLVLKSLAEQEILPLPPGVLTRESSGAFTEAVFKSWDQSSLILIQLAPQVLFWDGMNHLEDFLESRGHEFVLVRERIKRLFEVQILSPSSPYGITKQECLGEIITLLGGDDLKIAKDWGRFLFSRWKKGEPIPRMVLWEALGRGELWDCLPELATSLLEKGIYRNSPELLKDWGMLIEGKEGEDLWRPYVRSYELRKALMEKPLEEDLSISEVLGASDPGRENIPWQLQRGRFHLRKREIDLGLIPLKRSFFLSQEKGESIFEIQSSIEIGNALLAKKRVDEAREYFEIGQNLAGVCGCPYWVFRAQTHEAIAFFLWGDLTRCRECAQGALAQSFSLGRQEEKLFLMFLLGRSEFELGRYEEAREYWESAMTGAEEFGLEEVRGILNLWIGRAFVYDQKPKEGLSLIEKGKEGLEQDFFLSEVYYFLKDPHKGLDILSQADWSGARDRDGAFSLLNSWQTGFSNLEDRLLGADHEPSVLDFVIQGFEAFLMGLAEKEEEASLTLQSLMTKKELAQVDPYAHLYALWKGLLTVDSQEHTYRSTVFGRGLKDMHTRGSRISDRKDRFDFLHKSYWNKIYLEEAEKLKLV